MHRLTHRLELREAAYRDVEDLAAYHDDPRYLEYYDGKPEAEIIIAKAIEWATEDPRLNFQFIITLAGQSTAIGCVGLRTRDYPTGEGEIGIELAPAYWGQGYASEAVQELINLAETTGISTLHAKTHPTNRRAFELFERAGFFSFGNCERPVHMKRKTERPQL